MSLRSDLMRLRKLKLKTYTNKKVVADSKPQRHKSIPHPRVGELMRQTIIIFTMSKALRKTANLHLRLQETKLRQKPLCLISLRALISMWAISGCYRRQIEKTAQLKITLRQQLPTCRYLLIVAVFERRNSYTRFLDKR